MDSVFSAMQQSQCRVSKSAHSIEEVHIVLKRVEMCTVYIVMACIVMAFLVMAYVCMAYIFMARVVMVYILYRPI